MANVEREIPSKPENFTARLQTAVHRIEQKWETLTPIEQDTLTQLGITILAQMTDTFTTGITLAAHTGVEIMPMGRILLQQGLLASAAVKVAFGFGQYGVSQVAKHMLKAEQDQHTFDSYYLAILRVFNAGVIAVCFNNITHVFY